MSTEELKEYLGIVVDMEESIFVKKNICQEIDQEIEKLKIPRKFSDPTKPLAPLPPQPKEPKQNVLPYSIMRIIGTCIGQFFAIGLITTVITGYYAMFVGIAPREVSWPVSFSLIIPIAWVVHCIRKNKAISCENEKKKAESEIEYRDALKKYQEDLAQYQKTLKQHQKSLNENQLKRQQDEIERQLKTAFLESQRDEVKKKLDISEERLQTIYQKNFIFPKYRNLVMVCSLYEYICAGRCTELEGHEGAYNILETEIRLDRIISQLDKVIAQLEQIKQNQFMLYSAVQECNQRLGLIMGSIRQMVVDLNDFCSCSIQNSIQLNSQVAELNSQNTQLNAHIAELKKTSALTAYHVERTQKELAYMNRMDYLSGRNDSVFWNQPPI